MPGFGVAAKALVGLAPVILLAAAACGGGDGDDSSQGDEDDGGERGIGITSTSSASNGGSGERPTPAGSFDSDFGHCNVTLSGDIEAEFEAPGGASAIGSDYFLDEEAIRAALEFLDMSDDEIDAALSDNVPDLFLLLMNCVSADGLYSISLFPGDTTTYDDMPFGPGTYPITPSGLFSGEPGEVGALMTFGEDQASFSVSEPGELVIDEWNDDHIAGSFSFGASEDFVESGGRTVSVSADFDLRNPN